MALYSLTFAQLKSEAEHAIGGVPDARTSSARVVNAALEYLCTIFDWSWRVTITTLSLTNAVGQVDLPDDFGDLIDLVGSTVARDTAVRKADPATINRVRVFGITSNFSLVYFLGQKSQTAVTAPGKRVLEIAPLPTADLADALYLTYRKLIPTLSGDTDVPNIPYGYFELLRRLVRAIAVSDTIQQAGHDWQLFNSMLIDYKAADTAAGGSDVGTLRSQVDDMDSDVLRIAPHTAVLMPGDS
jgi:hypothetical protein